MASQSCVLREVLDTPGGKGSVGRVQCTKTTWGLWLQRDAGWSNWVADM